MDSAALRALSKVSVTTRHGGILKDAHSMNAYSMNAHSFVCIAKHQLERSFRAKPLQLGTASDTTHIVPCTLLYAVVSFIGAHRTH